MSIDVKISKCYLNCCNPTKKRDVMIPDVVSTILIHTAGFIIEVRIKQQCTDGFDLDDGPFCRVLDETLGKLKVHREAYYGGTFTGNHAHKCLKKCTHDTCTLVFLLPLMIHTQHRNST